MNGQITRRPLSRRDFLKVGGGLLAATAGAAVAPKGLLQPASVAKAERLVGPDISDQHVLAAPGGAIDLHLVGTDGWISVNAPAIPPFFPDNLAPSPFNMYIFGFANVTGLTHDQENAQKMKAQLAAPLFSIDQEYGYTLQLTNLGLQMRPDLIDSHTIHFHGFRNAIPIFDGEPHSSVGVPIIKDLVYYYKPHAPGTYMYHCHFEETEHVHMGMIGPCFVKPLLNQQNPGHKYVYNDAATEYNREFVMTAHEIWTDSHWCDSHIQLPEWTDYKADIFLLNGRAYPDTLLPNGGGRDAFGELIAPPGRPDLKFQPMSSLVRCNAGEKVLLRFINLGFTQIAMTLAGIKMKVVGRDAMLLKGRDGTDLSFMTNVAPIGAGETVDAIFTAPAFGGSQGLSDAVGAYDRYLLYNRAATHMGGGFGSAYGGQMTEVRVYAGSTVPAQTEPNT